jgi:hypothetical protein
MESSFECAIRMRGDLPSFHDTAGVVGGAGGGGERGLGAAGVRGGEDAWEKCLEKPVNNTTK